MLPEEKGHPCEVIFERVANAYGSNPRHRNAILYYMKNLWFMPATPILGNAGSTGMPISCFVNEVDDSINGISDVYAENIKLAASGGGIGTYWGNLRSIGEKVKDRGTTSGIIPFIKVQDSLSDAISQGNFRRGSTAAYLPINHPEIEEFIDIRRPGGGDPARKMHNLHHGVTISNAFMIAVQEGQLWPLKSPCSGEIIKTISARVLWSKLLTARIETGEPYIVFIDNVNENRSESYCKNALFVNTSNLCSEIMLSTGRDYDDNKRTAVCCLASLNLEKYDEWKQDADHFIHDILEFLDNVLQNFIDKAKDEIYKNAVYSAFRERSIGLGIMGLHSYMQKHGIFYGHFASLPQAVDIMGKIKHEIDVANRNLAIEKGACPDAERAGLCLRFSNCTAVAPTASISIICNTSPGIEPIPANAYISRTLDGTFIHRNRALEKILQDKYQKNNEDVWSAIIANNGSVQQLDFMDLHDKNIFKTAYEMNQIEILKQASYIQDFVDQSISINLFLASNISKQELHDIHWTAWKLGLKSLYYLRSQSIQRADKIYKCNQNSCEACE